MAIDYELVLAAARDGRLLTPEQLADADADEDFLPNLISEEAIVILSLSWDSDFPGGSGANYAQEWKGLFFFSSSDHDEEGPFSSANEVVDLDYFTFAGTPKPELDSDIIPTNRLIEIATSLVREEGKNILINKQRFVLRGGKLFATDRDF